MALLFFNFILFSKEGFLSYLFKKEPERFDNIIRLLEELINAYNLKGKSRTKESATRFGKPFRELLLWAVLLNRFELARFLWEQGEEAITEALTACWLFQVMHDKINEDHHEMRAEFKQHAV